MHKKMKKKRIYLLSAILGVLIVLTLITTLTDDKKAAGNFSSTLVDVRADQISRITINPGNGQDTFELLKPGEEWKIKTGGKEYDASESSVNNLVSSLTGLQATQMVTNKRDNWGEFNVDDTTGIKVDLFENEKLLSSLVVGRMTFAQSRNPYQQQPDAFTYVRKGKEKEVYKTRGMLNMTLSGGARNFRSGQITRFDKPNLQKIAFSYPADSSLVIEKVEEHWEIAGARADSANMESYLNSIRNFTSREFSEEEQPSGEPEFRLELTGTDMEPVTVTAWSKENGGYLVTSSLNRGTLFRLQQEQFNRLFRGRSHFLMPSIAHRE
jgi:hypothetical protein